MSQHYNFKSVVPVSGRVDKDNGVIRGVSLITGNLEAEGHKLQVDDTTLSQVHGYSAKRGKITVKMDHTDEKGKAFKSIVGYLTNFSVDGGKVRGDLELLKAEPLTPKIIEMAERMPENFGLSISFKGKGEKKSGKEFARCEKVLSVDLVEQPAANPDGLFSVPVDTRKNGMPETPEPTLADVLAAIQQQGQQLTTLSERINQHAEFIESVKANMGDPTLEELDAMSDEQLAEIGYTREQVDAAIEQAIQNGEMADPNGDPNATPGQPGTVGTPATTGALATATTGMSSKDIQKLIQFEIGKVRAQAREQAEEAEAEHALSVIETKVTELSAKNDELTTKLEALKAENESLRRTARISGGNMVRSGGDATLFSVKPEDTKEGSFEHHFAAKVKELTDGKVPIVNARSQAMDFCIRRYPGEYQQWRANGSKIELGK